jgi:DNA-3-methyladenine glycosylase II
VDAIGVSEAAFELHPRPPFRLDLTAWALRRRARNRIDIWDGRYRRALIIDDEPIAVDVLQIGPPGAPDLVVTVSASTDLIPTRLCVIKEVVERMLGLGVDLNPFYALADADPHLRVLKERFLGVKPPRFPTVFEALANAVANQQLTLEVGIELLNRLANTYGAPAPSTDGPLTAFPEAGTVADAPVADLRGLGFSTSKARYLIGLARDVSAGGLDLDGLDLMSREDATRYLQRLHGIGRWSAEYVLLRGLGRLDVFPGDDVGARNKLQRFLMLPAPPSYPDIVAILAPWYPYAGIVYFHLLLDGLVERGALEI